MHDASGHAPALSDGLSVLKQCPLCRTEYRDGDVIIIEDTADAELAYFFCGTCRAALLALMAQSPFGMSSVATMTDLSADDAKRFLGKQAFSEDDVLFFHAFLEQHTKTLARLFTPSV